MKAVSASKQVSARDLSRHFMSLFTVVHLTFYVSPQEPSPSDGIFLESLKYTDVLLRLVNWNVDRYEGIGWFSKSSHPILEKQFVFNDVRKKLPALEVYEFIYYMMSYKRELWKIKR